MELVTEAIIRSKAGIKDPTKPIGLFLIPGTYRELERQELAMHCFLSLFDDENNMVRIDVRVNTWREVFRVH